ncbi:unnamed protein product [Mesocestoides corti]|uniref:MARVEL domain-containing protein n=1 Tax=Mesocestoides corti TaxID=53468 RepID=A0A0R3U7C2_MESCO|nr:unnamed protein product [Mesocestoides corti]
MEAFGYKVDPRSFVSTPSFILRIVSLAFCIIIIACIDRDGYFAGRCLFYSGGSACGIALTTASFGLIFCLVYIAIDAIFLSIPQQNYRKYVIMVDLGFSGIWTFAYFFTFCYMANHWQRSDAGSALDNVNVNNIRASIAFAFFSIFSWAGITYTAYLRYQSSKTYNQYADDVIETRGSQGANVASSGGYIDYFNQPPSTQSGFDGAGTDEFVSDAHRAGDTDLLAS